jgi:uncharacterized protein (DUF342 family)
MPRNGDRGLESLIRGTEELIRDIPASALPAVGLPADGQVPAEARLDEDLRRQEAKNLAEMVEPSVDGSAQLTISRDQMLLLGTFFPPAGDGKPIELEEVQGKVEALGVTTGVDWEAVKGCIMTCNEDRCRVSDAVIARGRQPLNEVPPYLVVGENLTAGEKVENLAAARVDFRELSPFTLVKKGDVLASLVPAQAGVMGTTVRGNAVAFQKEKVFYPKPGKNTQWQEGGVTAACDGRFECNVTGFWVDEVLDIRGDIDYRVGNVDFPGDVVIQGDVRDGFAVKCGKSMLCLGAIDACRIDCGGDLVTRQGILGKEKAMLRVAGTTQAKFMEACSVDSDGSIYVRTSVLNCSVYTHGRLDMGERGIIIGGKIRAQNGVSAAQIGTDRGPKTEIHCGVDFKVEQRLIWIRDRNIALAFKLRETENKIKANPSTLSVLTPLRDRIRAAIHQLNENARSLVLGLDKNEEADVSVFGTVYPGTYIEICHVSCFVTRARRFVTFRLDKTSGKIIEKKWEKPPARLAAGA